MNTNHSYSEALIHNHPHYQKLFTQHEALEAELKKQDGMTQSDDLQVKRLKLKKLMVLDEMRRIERQRIKHPA